MKQAVIFVIILIALVVGGIYLYGRSQSQKINQSNTEQTGQMEQDPSAELQIEDVKTGTGPAAKPGDTVAVHYTGTFESGEKFDSSHDRGEPFQFTLGAGTVISGWDMGVAGMQVGGTRKLVIPPALGYGSQDRGPIPGNSTLYFTIDLLEIR